MTKVKIEPGPCGFTTIVTAEKVKGRNVEVHVETACPTVSKMMEELGTTFNSMDVCLKKPGENLFYEFVKKNYPAHAACITLNGIIKAIEAESRLALKRSATIEFLE